MLYGLTLMLSCFVLASCINDEEGPCLPDGKTQVIFSLVLPDNAQTRADAVRETWGSFTNHEPGVGYDNQIELDKVQFLLFKEEVKEVDGQEQKTYLYAGKLINLTYTQPGDPRESPVYQYIGDAPKGLKSGNYKFVVLANIPKDGLDVLDELGENTPLTDATIANLAFNYLGSGELPKIPMWGTKGVDEKTNLTVKLGTRQDIGTISLLRAVSKVTVKLSGNSEDLKGYSLTSVTVKNYNKSGYVLPLGHAGVTKTTDLEISTEKTMHVNASAGTDPLSYEPTAGDNEVTFYLPEYDNVSTGATPSVLSVKLTKETGGGEFVADINFCDYYKETTEDATKGTPDTSKPYNIVRNHYYLFNIYKVTEPSLWVEPTILPWTVDSEHDYTTGITVRMGTLNDNDKFLRYDSDKDFNSWAGSYIAAAYSELTTDHPAPLYSPPLRLVSMSKTPLYLHIDNPLFRFVKRNPDTETNQALDPETDIRIEPGSQTTIFYVVPIEDYNDAEHNARECHLSLISGDSTSGLAERVPLRSSLPGFAAGTDEVWFYWIGSTVWQNYKTEEGWKDYLMMYPDDF